MEKNKTLKIFASLCFIVTSLICICHNIALDDYTWHVKVGEWIIQNKEIPTTCIFSWSNGANHWYCHEWLSEVIFYFLYSISISKAPYLFIFFTVVIIGSLIMYFNKDFLLKNPIFFLIWTIIYTIIMYLFSNPRPHLITLICLILFINILDEIRNEKYKNFYLIPIITILWTNTHGGSTPLMYVIPLIYFIIGLLNFDMGKITIKRLKAKQLFTFFIIEVISLLSILINPIGIELLKYPFHVGSADNSFIREWQASSINTLPEAFILIIAICFILFMTKKEINLQDLANMGMFMIMTLIHMRFALWLLVVSSLYVFKYVPEYKIKNETLKFQIKDAIKIYPIVGFLVFLVLFFSNTFTPKQTIPDNILKQLKEDNNQRLYNDYNYGGALIYNGFESFIDARADSYQENEIYDETLNICFTFDMEKDKKIEEFIEKYNFDSFLLFEENYITIYLLENPDKYELVIKDETSGMHYFKTKGD